MTIAREATRAFQPEVPADASLDKQIRPHSMGMQLEAEGLGQLPRQLVARKDTPPPALVRLEHEGRGTFREPIEGDFHRRGSPEKPMIPMTLSVNG
jgi:hypothetical protein